MEEYQVRGRSSKNAYSPREVEQAYGIPVQTLANWRCQKTGPPFVKIGRKVLYLEGELDQFLQSLQVRTVPLSNPLRSVELRD